MAEDIQSYVEKTWKFIIPSLIEALVVIVITAYVFGTASFSKGSKAVISRFTILTDPETIKILETYGITKIMPIAVLFVIVLLAYALRRISHSIGGLLPGHLVPNSTSALLTYVDPYALAEVTQFFPSFIVDENFNKAQYINNLNNIIEEKVNRAEIEGKASPYSWAVHSRKAFNQQNSMLTFLKFLLIWVLFLAVAKLTVDANLWPTLGRVSLLLLVSLIGIGVLLKRKAHYFKQYNIAKIYALRTELEAQFIAVSAPDRSKFVEIRNKLAELADESESWGGVWSFQIGNLVVTKSGFSRAR